MSKKVCLGCKRFKLNTKICPHLNVKQEKTHKWDWKNDRKPGDKKIGKSK